MQKTNFTASSLDKLELSNKPKLYLSAEIQKQINYLHSRAGSTEWSGELIVKETGSITDLDDFVMRAEDIYLVDIGSAAFTGYEVDKGAFKAPDIINMFESFPGLLEGTHKNHHIHTHHNMSAFFSGTDWSNLNDRALESDYFMMLIVNFAGNYVAKVAFKAKRADNSKTVLEFANNADNHRPIELDSKVAKEVLVVMDCEIFLEPVDDGLTDSFKQRYQKVKVESSKPTYVNNYVSNRATPRYSQGTLGTDKSNDGWDEEPWFNAPPSTIDLGDKPISSMTDKEFNNYDSVFSGSKMPEVEKFNEKSAKRFINCALSGTKDIWNMDDPMVLIKKIDKKIQNGNIRKYDFLKDLENDHLSNSFDKLFPKNNIVQYMDLLSVTKELLSNNRKDELARSIVKVLDNEMETVGTKIGRLIND